MVFAIARILLKRNWNVGDVIRRDLHLINDFYLNRQIKSFNLKTLVCNQRKQFSSAKLAVSEVDLKKFFINVETEYMSESWQYGDYAEILRIPSIGTLLEEHANVSKNIKSLSELFDGDKEMMKLADEEKQTYENRLEQIQEEVLDSIVNNYIRDKCNDVILELTAGVGGQESMLFLKELFEMYQNYFDHLGFTHNLIELDNAAQGGLRHASMTVSGKDVMETLKYEGGVHRVQRVPATERLGRIHTSVVSVAVLPQPTEIEISINPKDLKVDAMRASGAGGQHVNTTNSAVRVTHIPSGIVVECQVERSAYKNRELAMLKLRTKLYEQKFKAQTLSTISSRKRQMGLGLRNEKIRTYNFNQDRVTDHRLTNGTMYNLKRFLEGGDALGKLHERLEDDFQQKALTYIIEGRKLK